MQYKDLINGRFDVKVTRIKRRDIKNDIFNETVDFYYTGALEIYNKALTIDPNNTFALTNKDAILDMLGNNTTPGNATNFLEYENSTYGIKMQYFSDWQSVGGASNSSIVASFSPQRNYASYVTIQIENLSTEYTPDQYLNSLMLGDAIICG
jgi:hypothetical protein